MWVLIGVSSSLNSNLIFIGMTLKKSDMISLSVGAKVLRECPEPKSLGRFLIKWLK